MKRELIVFLIASMILGCNMISSPEKAYKQITEYANKGDWGAVYDSLDGYSKGQVDISMKMLMSFAIAFSDDATKEDFSKLTGRDLFIRMAENNEVKAGDFVSKQNYKVIKTERKGNKATLFIKDNEGSSQEVAMVLENGSWKLHTSEEGKTETTSSPKKRKLTIAEKAEKAKQEKLAKEMQEKERAEKARLKQIITVALVEKSFIESDVMRGRYNDYITIKLALENNSDKDIKAVKGVLIFKDVFGDKIYSAGFKYDEGIKSHSKKIWDGTLEYNQFTDSHQKLRTTELKNLIFEWMPETILFEDGSKLGE